MNVPFWVLLPWCLLLVYLLWRVWRLEGKVEFYSEHYEKRCDLNADTGRDKPTKLSVDIRFEDHRRVMNGLARNMTALARALGCEWKRTDAKEGWEKKPAAPFGFGIGDMTAYRNAIDHAISVPPIWVAASVNARAGFVDRRKADRRKPTPQVTPQVPRKKRRAAR